MTSSIFAVFLIITTGNCFNYGRVVLLNPVQYKANAFPVSLQQILTLPEGRQRFFNLFKARGDFIKLANQHIQNYKPYNYKQYKPYNYSNTIFIYNKDYMEKILNSLRLLQTKQTEIVVLRNNTESFIASNTENFNTRMNSNLDNTKTFIIENITRANDNFKSLELSQIEINNEVIASTTSYNMEQAADSTTIRENLYFSSVAPDTNEFTTERESFNTQIVNVVDKDVSTELTPESFVIKSTESSEDIENTSQGYEYTTSENCFGAQLESGPVTIDWFKFAASTTEANEMNSFESSTIPIYNMESTVPTMVSTKENFDIKTTVSTDFLTQVNESITTVILNEITTLLNTFSITEDVQLVDLTTKLYETNEPSSGVTTANDFLSNSTILPRTADKIEIELVNESLNKLLQPITKSNNEQSTEAQLAKIRTAKVISQSIVSATNEAVSNDTTKKLKLSTTQYFQETTTEMNEVTERTIVEDSSTTDMVLIPNIISTTTLPPFSTNEEYNMETTESAAYEVTIDGIKIIKELTAESLTEIFELSTMESIFQYFQETTTEIDEVTERTVVEDSNTTKMVLIPNTISTTTTLPTFGTTKENNKDTTESAGYEVTIDGIKIIKELPAEATTEISEPPITKSIFQYFQEATTEIIEVPERTLEENNNTTEMVLIPNVIFTITTLPTFSTNEEDNKDTTEIITYEIPSNGTRIIKELTAEASTEILEPPTTNSSAIELNIETTVDITGIYKNTSTEDITLNMQILTHNGSTAANSTNTELNMSLETSTIERVIVSSTQESKSPINELTISKKFNSTDYYKLSDKNSQRTDYSSNENLSMTPKFFINEEQKLMSGNHKNKSSNREAKKFFYASDVMPSLEGYDF